MAAVRKGRRRLGFRAHEERERRARWGGGGGGREPNIAPVLPQAHTNVHSLPVQTPATWRE